MVIINHNPIFWNMVLTSLNHLNSFIFYDENRLISVLLSGWFRILQWDFGVLYYMSDLNFLLPPARINVARLAVVYGQPGHINSSRRKQQILNFVTSPCSSWTVLQQSGSTQHDHHLQQYLDVCTISELCVAATGIEAWREGGEKGERRERKRR